MDRKTALALGLLVAMSGAALAQNEAKPAAAKPADAKAPDTNNEAHEFLKSKVDKAMYNLLDKGMKSAIVTSELNMSMGPSEVAVKSKYVWQADPPREKFTMDDAGLPPQAAMMKGMLEENLKESCRKMLLPASIRMKDTQLSLTKTDDGNVAIGMPEKSRSMGPMTIKMQETWVYSAEGKLVRTEMKMQNPMSPEPQTQTSVPVLKEVDGKFLIVGTQEKSAQGEGKSEIKFEEKDGFQLPVESKTTTAMGDRVVKISITPNPKLTDADFADAPKAAENKDAKKGG